MTVVDQVAELRDRARQDVGLEPKYVRPAPPARQHASKPATVDEPTTEDRRAQRLASGPQSGDGWHLEWATSAFTGQRFQYVVIETLSPPWVGLDDMLIARGLLSRAELERETLGSTPSVKPLTEEEVYAF